MKRAAFLAMIATMSCAASTTAQAANWIESSQPYVGAEVQGRILSYDRNQGGNLFKKRFLQGNIFAGFRFNPCVGLEIGYEATKLQGQSTTLSSGQFEIGRQLVAGETDTFSTSARLDGIHLDVLGHFKFCECQDVEFSALLGVGYLRAKFSANTISSTIPAVAANARRDFTQTKAVARVGLVANYLITHCIGIRASVIWENTSRFRQIRPTNAQLATNFPNIFIRLNDSVNFGLGGFINF